MKTIVLITCAVSLILAYIDSNNYHQKQKSHNYQPIQARQEAQIQQQRDQLQQQGTQQMMQQMMQSEKMRRING